MKPWYKNIRWLAGLILVTVPGVALAGPGGGGGIVGAVLAVAAVVAAPFTAGLSLGYFAAAVIGAAAVGYMIGSTVEMMINPPSFDMPDVGSGAAESQNAGVTVNKQGTNLSIPVVYGQRKMGGIKVFLSTNGENNTNLYLAMVLAEGEINAITKVWIDDTLVWTGTTTHGETYAANQTNGFKDKFTFQAFHGTTNQTYSTLLNAASGWGTDKPLSGLAYIACKCIWPKVETNDEARANPWGGNPNIVVELQGKRVSTATNLAVSYSGLTYEQRKSFTNYFTTTAYSNNPIECFLDYLRNDTYGKGLEDSQIDFHSFYRERVRWIKDQAGNTLADSKLHTTNAVIFTDRTVMDNVKTFLLNMRSSLVYQDGKYRLVVVDNGNESSIYGETSTEALTITTDDIIDGLKVEAESGENKFNRVIVSYMGNIDGDGNKTYEAIEYTYPEAGSTLESTYQSQDNGRVVEHRITLEHITDKVTAAKLAEIILERSRKKGKTIQFQGTARLYQLEVGDVVRLQYPSLSIDGRYRVKSVIQNMDFTFAIILEEHDDVAYAFNPAPQAVTGYQRKYLGEVIPPGFTGPVLPTPTWSIPKMVTIISTTVNYVQSLNVARLAIAYSQPNDTTIKNLRIYKLTSGTGTYNLQAEVPVYTFEAGRTTEVSGTGFLSPGERGTFKLATTNEYGNESLPYLFTITAPTNTSTITNGVRF